mmetsp:Transcript_22960/g.39387  ORF Transcript_22960/g.39387 Transcript_22960/m.39387 type:complete len:87 (+) Transcript_22960:1358-1618(+)
MSIGERTAQTYSVKNNLDFVLEWSVITLDNGRRPVGLFATKDFSVSFEENIRPRLLFSLEANGVAQATAQIWLLSFKTPKQNLGNR